MAAKSSSETQITEESMMEGMKKYIQENGPSHVNQFISSQLEAWKSVPIHVAVTGSSGAGKSSFINCIRDVDADHEEAAKVDVKECTTVPTAYDHPKNKQLKFWDLPGVGTSKFPRSSYASKVNFPKYDFFVIISCTRFTEEDIWLAKEVQRLGKAFFFVHSKVDADIENDERDNPTSHLPEEVKRTIRKDCKDKLSAKGFHHPEVFLISNHFKNEYDFPGMNEKFIKCLPAAKQEAWRLSIKDLSVAAIREKRKVLQGRLWLAATASAGAAALPVPGLDIAVDLAILSKYQSDYMAYFSLDDKSLNETAINTRTTVQDIKNKFTPQVIFYLNNILFFKK